MTDTGPVARAMTEKLEKAFSPTRLRVINESARHIGHAGHDGGGESHFRLEMSSPIFTGKSRLECQRMVHAALAEELAGPVHALSMALEEA